MKCILNALLAVSFTSALQAEPVALSGIYPHLTMFNDHSECGTGAVVPWADKLWVITYAPHYPYGSSDKLYSISEDLTQTIQPESVGGTPANRMIHKESQQLFIGPYAISKSGAVRALSPKVMPGRHTGNARHLFDPGNKIYYATMEEGIYEVDTKTLMPTELWADEQKQTGHPPKGFSTGERPVAKLPGYHGKGLYSGQGVLVYANNGETGKKAKTNPTTSSGALAEWDGKSDQWTVIRRNQFTEITGPGGISGNPNPATDPIWSVGWDDKSLLLGVRTPEKKWSFYRLPKGSHSYDGAHGWNTEWPRIREVGTDHFLMTMHGTFWQFPKSFSPNESAGIAPHSNYLKVIGDFCRWNDHLVLGCDDTAKSEFLNKSTAKGEIAAPQSQSNLWFIEPHQLGHLGPAIGRGCVWKRENVKKGTISDPFLASGYDIKNLSLKVANKSVAKIELEIDELGNGQWKSHSTIEVSGNKHLSLTGIDAAWIRLIARSNLSKVTTAFSFRNQDSREIEAAPLFDGLARPQEDFTAGIVRALDDHKGTLAFAATDANGKDIAYYELGADLLLKQRDDQPAHSYTKQHANIPTGPLTADEASMIYTDDDGKRWRIPKAGTDFHPLGNHRIAREVATERDFFNAGGTFYELPARNAGGFSKVRPVATHNRLIHDFCSFRGLLIMSGVATERPSQNKHTIVSNDGKVALWAGAIDDTWKLGKPRGKGGPWKNSPAKAGAPSDPYLMTAYDKKSLHLSAKTPCTITAEIDLTGDGNWSTYKTFQIEGETHYEFPETFSAYWIRFTSSRDNTASAQLRYW